MKKFKVTVDHDEVIENVLGWSVSGNILLLTFADGSARGLTGWVDFTAEVIMPNVN